MPAILHALDGRYHRARRRRRSAAHARRPADRPQSARLRSVPHPQRLRAAGRRAAGRRAAGALRGRRQRVPRVRGDGAVGHRQPEDRRRPDRAGAGAARRAPALRQLRPALRRRTDPARRAGPAADRRRGHAVRHLPRPAAAADQTARRGRAISPRRPTSRSNSTSCASTRSPIRPSTAATSRRRRCACSATPKAPTAPTSTILIDSGAWNDEDELAETYLAPQGLRLRPQRASRRSRTRAARSSADDDVDFAYQNLDSVELGVTTVDHYFDTLGGISRAVSARAAASRRRSTSATRRAAKARCAR